MFPGFKKLMEAPNFTYDPFAGYPHGKKSKKKVKRAKPTKANVTG